MKGKNHTISTDTEKAFNKIPYTLNNKNFQTDLAPRLRRPVELSRAPEASGADVEMLHNLEGLLKQSLTCPTPEFLIQ